MKEKVFVISCNEAMNSNKVGADESRVDGNHRWFNSAQGIAKTGESVYLCVWIQYFLSNCIAMATDIWMRIKKKCVLNFQTRLSIYTRYVNLTHNKYIEKLCTHVSGHVRVNYFRLQILSNVSSNLQFFLLLNVVNKVKWNSGKAKIQQLCKIQIGNRQTKKLLQQVKKQEIEFDEFALLLCIRNYMPLRISAQLMHSSAQLNITAAVLEQ